VRWSLFWCAQMSFSLLRARKIRFLAAIPTD
jgi:hypothetical protein